MDNNDFFTMFDPNGNVAPDNTEEINIQTPVEMPQQQPVKAERVPKNNNSMPVQNTNVVQTNATVNNQVSLKNKSYYTDAEWTAREAIYVEECNKIHIDPTNLTSYEIAIAAGQIDTLLTPLRIDNIYMQRECNRYDDQLKIKKELYYSQIKSQANNAKITVDETKSLIAKAINDDRNYEDNMNIYELNARYAARFVFTKGMIDALQDKKDLLITYSAVLKIDNTTNNFTPSVPTQNQINRMGQ